MQNINDALATLTPEQHDRALDGLKKALLDSGAKELPIDQLVKSVEARRAKKQTL